MGEKARVPREKTVLYQGAKAQVFQEANLSPDPYLLKRVYLTNNPSAFCPEEVSLVSAFETTQPF